MQNVQPDLHISVHIQLLCLYVDFELMWRLFSSNKLLLLKVVSCNCSCHSYFHLKCVKVQVQVDVAGQECT